MFDRMQYVFDSPVTIHIKRMWRFQIIDSDGKELGSFTRKELMFPTSTKEARGWFEDKVGARLGEMRTEKGHRMSGLEVYDSMNQLRGRIGYSSWMVRWAGSFGPCTLDDSTGHQIAMTDSFSEGLVLGIGNKFDSFRRNGLNVRATDGSIVASISKSIYPNSCQIDLFSPDIDRLLILSLIAFVILY